MQLKDAYIRQMKSLLGEAGFFEYLSALEGPPQRALRLNLLFFPEEPPDFARPLLGDPVPWAKGAYFVPAGERPGLSPLHEAGAYYLQEPSALAPVSVLDPRPGERILDLCAAPGGKSTQIAGLMQGRGLLICNEPIPSRAQILSRNVERMGIRNALVLCARPEQLSPRFPGFFDRVLVDAPCSGEGMFRREPAAIEEWEADAPARCAARQLEILSHAALMLRPGGRLVYSTCTFNAIENEGVISSFLAAHTDYRAESFALPGLPAAAEGMLHLFPHQVRGEGHFVACLRREGKAEGLSVNTVSFGNPAGLELLASFLSPEAMPGSIRREGDTLFLPPEGIEPSLLRGLRVLRAGLRLAALKGSRAEPDHALALSLRPEEAARSFALTREQALLYQAGEALDLGDLPEGYTLLCHQGKSLGWGKQAGGIMKNHYPKGLRRRQDSLLNEARISER